MLDQEPDYRPSCVVIHKENTKMKTQIQKLREQGKQDRKQK